MPSVGATGLSFAHSRVDIEAAEDRRLVHAAPRQLAVTVGVQLDGHGHPPDQRRRHGGPLQQPVDPFDHLGGNEQPAARVTTP
jgi:hypothetical protein